MNTPTSSDPQISEPLARSLKEAFGASPEVDSEIDRRIRGQIGVHFTRLRHRRWWRHRGLPWVAAASVFLGLFFLASRSSSPEPAVVVAREDIDADGRVDMLDAFALARTLRDRPNEAPAAWDQDGDGRVDRADVEMVAAAAVRLGPR